MSAQEIDNTEVEEVVQTTEASVAPISLGGYSDKELRGNPLFARLMLLSDIETTTDSKAKDKWIANSKEVEGCTLEQVSVDYCRYKAVRITSTFNCSLATFEKVLSEEPFIRQYDVDLNKFEILEKKANSVILYTNYHRRSRFIAPRDFVIESANKTLTPEEAVAEKVTKDAGNAGVFITNSTSVPNLKDLEKDWTRGTIYVFGYIAIAEGPNKIKVINYACVDPSGKIPPMVADATASLSCKKIATIRSLCESIEKQK